MRIVPINRGIYQLRQPSQYLEEKKKQFSAKSVDSTQVLPREENIWELRLRQKFKEKTIRFSKV